MIKILVTGAAGFIGVKVSEFLLCTASCGKDGYKVIGMDNMNDAYEMRLRHWRLDRIKQYPNTMFHKMGLWGNNNFGNIIQLFYRTRDPS